MAHELTHVANRDVMVMTLAASSPRSPPTSCSSGSCSAAPWPATTTTARAAMVVLLVSFAVYVVSFFLMQALSRYREFAADRGSALITGRPSALASR